VTFPAPRLLERIWRKPDGTVGVPRNVLESAERLRRELRPERGPVDWRPVAERRRRAEARIKAVEEYARGSGCRRARLVSYFGEKLERCAGCDRCGMKPLTMSLDRETRERVSRLRRALAHGKTVWGGCPLEPEVLLRLAKSPPVSAAALADVPGVGAALVEKLGGAILRALSPHESVEELPSTDPLVSSLKGWRAGVAREMGVPTYVVLPDATLHTIAEQRPRSRNELAAVHGVGPRTLAKFGNDLLGLVEQSINKPLLNCDVSGS
jgi:superfamily II DNA helicase RecQ